MSFVSSSYPNIDAAVVTVVLEPVACASNFRVAVAPLAKFPMVHVPVVESYAPSADTNLSPAGSGAITVTPVALFGPLLRAVIVNKTLS